MGKAHLPAVMEECTRVVVLGKILVLGQCSGRTKEEVHALMVYREFLDQIRRGIGTNIGQANARHLKETVEMDFTFLGSLQAINRAIQRQADPTLNQNRAQAPHDPTQAVLMMAKA